MKRDLDPIRKPKLGMGEVTRPSGRSEGAEKSDLEEMIRVRRRWAIFNDRIRKATMRRDRALWRFLKITVTYAQMNNLRTRKKIRALVLRTNSSLDAKARSRYVNLIRVVVRRKPRGASVRSWVKAHGGISRCR